MTFTHAAVVGSGVMGSGIAAHLANAGLQVLLLDVPSEGGDRSHIARAAIRRARNQKPAPFTSERAVSLVTPGNLEDDLPHVGDCDWIVEAVTEDLGVKHEVYATLDSVRRPGSIVTSNTSTLPLADLSSAASDGLRRDLLVTHFFNPPRYLRLLEIVAGPETRSEAVRQVSDFADNALGKVVIRSNDTPGFIANRLGCAWIDQAIAEALSRGISVEIADAVISRSFGCPKTGIFGLLDLVGIDLALLVDRSLRARLVSGDPLVAINPPTELLESMVATGRTGRKGDGGFYRLEEAEGRRSKLVLDLVTSTYRAAEAPRLPTGKPGRGEDLRAFLEGSEAHAAFAWAVLSSTLAYAAHLVPEVTGNPADIDRAMETGYAWQRGPFRLIDDLGAAQFASRLEQEGRSVPPLVVAAAQAGGFYRPDTNGEAILHLDGTRRPVKRPTGTLTLRDVKRLGNPVRHNEGAALWNLGDSVLCLEFTTKANSIDKSVLRMMQEAVGLLSDAYRALVLYTDDEHFSVGASIPVMLDLARRQDWSGLEALARLGQDTFAALKYAPAPVVGAPAGRALGGGCEVLLHCDALSAHAESYLGLVETKVGIVPGWGGCKEILLRMIDNPPYGPMNPVQRAFDLISRGTVSTSAAEARNLGFLRDHDQIINNRDRLLFEAKALALKLADDYLPPEERELRLPGPSGHAALSLTMKSVAKRRGVEPHDLLVADLLAQVLSGGHTDPSTILVERDILDLERNTVLSLFRTEETQRLMANIVTRPA